MEVMSKTTIKQYRETIAKHLISLGYTVETNPYYAGNDIIRVNGDKYFSIMRRSGGMIALRIIDEDSLPLDASEIRRGEVFCISNNLFGVMVDLIISRI